MASTMPTPPKLVANPSRFASNFDKAERASSNIELPETQSSLKSSTFSTTYSGKTLLSHTNTEGIILHSNLRQFLMTFP
jgi:hypothetical protein